MAIVGPNGCGKSNISDSIRWVLGEQSAKALRGASMADVIFSGTDTHKPLGMGEVSITLADCESVLGTEFNEVTVTRRVFRSGESEYLLNKTPCRLRDIQRLFMDTGIGTNSYSLMEQGRIDRILSARPEDRRAVFEEASGITKFKADKREAMRKLEQTDQNLLRLADIIREVKRQIISLQRQAGKARRYQELQERLRSFDLFFMRDRLAAVDADLQQLDARRTGLSGREASFAEESEQKQKQVDAARGDLATRDHDLDELRETIAQSRAELNRALDTIRTNDERVNELTRFSRQNSAEEENARASLAQHSLQQAQIEKDLSTSQTARQSADAQLAQLAEGLRACETKVDAALRDINQRRSALMEEENRTARLQKELEECDLRDRNSQFRRARLEVEQTELHTRLQQTQSATDAVQAKVTGLRKEISEYQQRCAVLEGDRAERQRQESSLKQQLSELKSKASAHQAQIDMLRSHEQSAQGFAGGARWLLDARQPSGVDRSAVLGTLARWVRAEAGYEICLQVALRPWLDAVVVQGAGAALDILRELARQRVGSARLLVPDASGTTAPSEGPGESLRAHVTCDPSVESILHRLLAPIRVVQRLEDVPSPLPRQLIFVTPTGQLISGQGEYEYWMAEAEDQNPLARQQHIASLESQLAEIRGQSERLEQNLRDVLTGEEEAKRACDEARQALDRARIAEATQSGEDRKLQQDLRQSRQRMEAVTDELSQLVRMGSAGVEKRAQLASEIEASRTQQTELRARLAEDTERQRELDSERARRLGEVSDARVLAADRRRDAEDAERRLQTQRQRIEELQALIEERARGVETYQSRISELVRSSADLRDQIQPMENEIKLYAAQLDRLRDERELLAREIAALDQALRQQRQTLDALRSERSEIDVSLAQQHMRRQNLLDRAMSEYRAGPADIAGALEPEWGEETKPADADALESLIADMKARMESMGPVNLIAIEEHREHEERHAFLTQQQDDLVKAKEQLVEMIGKINQTTTDLFSDTFNKVNANFKDMFTKLFGGGTAHLVLVDEGDVLESGIEIVARPPGKKPTTVSLLSGGERTLTAVALLFSLYLVKPSPFCVLDELDAALDDTNIGRFVSIVQGFLNRSQFIIITHNRQTIAASNVLYGVTMEKHGISKIVSVRFDRTGRVEHGRTDATPSAESAPDAGAAGNNNAP